MKYLTEEDHLHIAVRQYLELQYPHIVAIHVPSEGKRSRWEAMKAKKLGLKAGISDWLIFAPSDSGSRGLALELKSAKGVVSPAQKAFQSQMRQNGWAAEIARDFDTAKKFIDEFLTR